MIKYLRVTMPDGSKWDIPAKVIIEDKEKKTKEKSLQMDNEQIIEWAAKNLHWLDVKRCAIKVINGQIDYQRGLAQGEKEIIEK